jgi:fructokinase
MIDSTHKHQVVCFGEVLWDIFPSGAVPGGAPMNVAYHLHKQNKNPALITKIGLDDEGKELINVFSAKGICTDFFQVDYVYQTGKVFAKANEDNEVVYDIVQPVAWDYIKWEDNFKLLVEEADFFVFGSLAARNLISKNTLFSLLEIAKNKVLDINLRAPHFNRHIVEELLQKADFVKMNIAELELITGWFSAYSSTEDRLKLVRDKFNINNMVVTMGGDGAMLYRNDEIILHNGFKVDVVDTVGSGDAFLAGMLARLLDNSTTTEVLDFACKLGAFIATQRGACPEYELEDVTQLIDINT